MNFGFVIDNRKCIGCHACTVACKSEHDVPVGVNRTWVKYIEKGEYPHTRRLFSVMRCNHCENAPCVEICPVEALHVRDDGIVDFDGRRCIGCKACMQACPYDALYIDPQTHTAAKCNYCAHRVDIGLEPACVNVCPEHAIISGDMDNPDSEIAQLIATEQVTARKVEKGTRPKLFYIDGDEVALNPTATPQQSDYMWSAQSSGVGHFAKYAEALVAKADPITMVKQLSGDNDTSDQTPGKALPDSEASQGNGNPITDLLRTKARRVYDAPVKGVLWGWEVSAYVWTKAIAAGSFLLVFMAAMFGVAQPESSVWLGWGSALLFLTLTGILLIKDLDQPGRFLYVLLRPQWQSWLTKGGYAITIYGAMLTLWGIGKWTGLPALTTVALWGGAIFAVITAVYTAFLFAQAKGRDFWQSPTLSLHMLVHSIMAGSAILSVFMVTTATNNGWQSFLNITLISAVLANLLILVSELTTTHPTEDAHRTVKSILSGRYRVAFWGGAILLGNLLPLVLLLALGSAMLPVAGAMVLVGIYITEHVWVQAPQMIPLS